MVCHHPYSQQVSGRSIIETALILHNFTYQINNIFKILNNTLYFIIMRYLESSISELRRARLEVNYVKLSHCFNRFQMYPFINGLSIQMCFIPETFAIYFPINHCFLKQSMFFLKQKANQIPNSGFRAIYITSSFSINMHSKI